MLLRGAEPIADGESGLKSVKLLEAIYTASRTGHIETVKEAVEVI